MTPPGPGRRPTTGSRLARNLGLYLLAWFFLAVFAYLFSGWMLMAPNAGDRPDDAGLPPQAVEALVQVGLAFGAGALAVTWWTLRGDR